MSNSHDLPVLSRASTARSSMFATLIGIVFDNPVYPFDIDARQVHHDTTASYGPSPYGSHAMADYYVRCAL